MKLKLLRTQKSGMMGKVTFSLRVSSELTAEEQTAVKTYKMGKEVLYQKMELEGGSGLLGLASSLALKAINITVTVNDLVKGRSIDCNDIVEMCAIEEQIKQACSVFKEILEAAATFDGEEIIEI